MPNIFFKLNNHDMYKGGLVAYYANPQKSHPTQGVSYSSDIDSILTISMTEDHKSSFAQCQVGDMIVIFQTIKKISRVVTHVLEVQKTNLVHKQNAQHPWQYFLSTKVKARLKPTVLSSKLSYQTTSNYDLIATQAPTNRVKIYDLGLNKNTWPQSGNLMDIFDGKQLQKSLIQNHVILGKGFELSKDWPQWISRF